MYITHPLSSQDESLRASSRENVLPSMQVPGKLAAYSPNVALTARLCLWYETAPPPPPTVTTLDKKGYNRLVG